MVALTAVVALNGQALTTPWSLPTVPAAPEHPSSPHFPQDADPELFWHVLSLGVAPARLAAPWLFSCFAGALESLQTLLLWDRGEGRVGDVAQQCSQSSLQHRRHIHAWCSLLHLPNRLSMHGAYCSD